MGMGVGRGVGRGSGRIWRGLAAILLLVAVAGCSPKPQTIAAGRLGDVLLFTPEGPAAGIVFLFGSGEGWLGADTAAARDLAAAGAVVVGIELGQYRQRVVGMGHACLYLIGDIEQVSRTVERRQHFAHYLTPILAGSGEAGALVQAMVAQAPARTITGAAVVDPAAKIDLGQPICTAPPRDVGVPGAPGFRLAAFSDRAPAAGRAAVEQARAAGLPVEIAPLPAAPSLAESLALLATTRIGVQTEQPPSASIGVEIGADIGAGIRDLPLVELPPARPGAPLVVILSGDGGWRDIDKVLAGALHDRGLAVLGWDSLSYFWTAKTPAELARDLAAALAYYSKRWRTGAIALVGYSFGADVLPFAVNRLPEDLRRRIVQLSLLGYAGKADFEIHVSGWLGEGPTAAAMPGAPEMVRLDPRKVQCFYGAGESDSACPGLAARGAEVIEMAGGHHLGGDYAAVADEIARGLARRGVAVP